MVRRGTPELGAPPDGARRPRPSACPPGGPVGVWAARGIVLAACALAASGACSPDDHPDWLTRGGGLGNVAAGSEDGLGLDAGPSAPGPDASGLCGNEFHQIELDAPNIYFVLDASGSMSAETGDGSRFEVVRESVIDLVRGLGPLINVGCALFPGVPSDDPCAAGVEVLPMSPGDPIAAYDGPTTEQLVEATDIVPTGGTPTGKTLAVLAPDLKDLGGRTIVVLATDGAPNCNAAASCGLGQCIANIEGTCASAANCCAPGGEAGPELCIDESGTIKAISGIAAAGIDVFVIGIPGSEIYADVLDAMAEAGGTAQKGKSKYFRVDDLDKLSSVLGSIAGSVIPCEVALEDPPEVPGKTNVYFDGELIPYDPDDGWDWQSEQVVELHGEACDRLKSGKVSQVQIVSGCPTEVK